MDQAQHIQVRVLEGKRECDRFMMGLSHKPTLNKTFRRKSDAVDFLNKYRMRTGRDKFAFFINKSLDIKTGHFAGLQFVQYEF